MTNYDFGLKINNFERQLLGFAIKLTKDTNDAQDLLQETFIKAYTNKNKFQEGTNLKAWLFTIMRNSFITNYQKLVRRKTYIDTSEDLHLINSSLENSFNDGMHNLNYCEINEKVSSLDEKHREPFVLYVKGYKYVEIAEKLRIPLGTVKNRIHVARQELKYFLSKYRGEKQLLSA